MGKAPNLFPKILAVDLNKPVFRGYINGVIYGRGHPGLAGIDFGWKRFWESLDGDCIAS